MANLFLKITNSTNPSSAISIRQAIYDTFLVPVFGLICLGLIFIFDINQSLFISLNGISQSTGELLWAGLTLLGDPVIVFCLALSLHAIAPQISFAILPTLIIGGSAVFYFKDLFAVVRPPGLLEDIIVIGQAPVSGAFPSGHTTGAFALATLLMLLTANRHIKAGLFIIALLAGVSRIAVGVHWPLDVSAGIVLGWLSAILGVQISKNWQYSQNKTRIINLLLLIFSFYLFFRNTGYAQMQLVQFTIALSGIVIAIISLLKIYKGQTTNR